MSTLALVSSSRLVTHDLPSPINPERMHSERRERAVTDIHRTVADLVSSGRPPDVGFRMERRRRFGGGGQRAKQVRGWVYRVERVRWRDGDRMERRYHAVMESGLFVVTATSSGLLTPGEYAAGKRVGPRSFGYVGFSNGHLHFSTAGQAEEFVDQLREAFGLPSAR